MTLNSVTAYILRFSIEFGSSGRTGLVVEDVVVKSSRSLSNLLMSFL